jgi:DNA (cytosine-5)-methyltransferase 1
MYGLDLFSGIGGITKALEGYVSPVAYCEIEPYARAVLLSRMAECRIPQAPIWDDVNTLTGAILPPVDIIYGGFPCQDISVAGRGAGLAGGRSGLFFQIVRLAKEIQPKFLFLENVPNIRTKGLSRVVRELADIGYDCRWCTISAAEIGAPHKRERWFLLAHARRKGPQEALSEGNDGGLELSEGRCAFQIQTTSNGRGWWDVEPNVGRVAHGVPKRVDRLRALGNAVVPAQAREAFERLMGLK